MDWSKVKAFPKYNPHLFELCRCLDGAPRYKFAKAAGLTTKRYSAIENGDVVPTDEEFQGILGAQTHVIASFFEQWPEYELDMSGPLARNVPIDYYKYKVFRDLNPPRMGVVR
jgi:transcriptional regulator with XRE-family HTH domain